MPQIGSIQALRAIAALLVAFGHLQSEALSMAAAAQGFHPILLDLTGAGVDLFFVISGFVMTLASQDLFGARDGVRVFLARRVARIAPLYWIATSLFLLVLFLAPSSLSSAAPTASEIVRSYLFIPYANGGGVMQPVYKLGWTLNYEMFFYILFAGALMLPRRAAVATTLGLLAALVGVGVWRAPAPGWLAFWTNPIILEFALGVGIAALRIEGARLRTPGGLILAAAGCLGFAGGLLLDLDPYGALRPLVWGLPAAFIVAAAALSDRPWPANRAARAMVALGDASYAIYLLHPIIIRALRMVWDRAGASAAMSPWLFIAAALAVIALVSILVFRRFEKPVTRALQAALGARSGRSAGRPPHGLRASSGLAPA